MDLIPRLNELLSGRYEVEREIGAGGMATVYLARDLRHGRRVALKVLRADLASALGPERFLAEIQVTAKLQHPHLLPLFDSGEAEGRLFYVMPYIEGETLRQRLRHERQLPVEEAVRIAVAVAQALDCAHRHAVVHRDLKPENILLQEGQPLVADFGIALALSAAGAERVTRTGLSLGTPQYMSPEQATGDRQVDARSDVYSLGAILYEMLAGDPPHQASTVQATIAKVLTDRPQRLRTVRESVPEHVEAAVLRALAKLPADRFASAGEMAEVLTGARPIALTPVPGFNTGVGYDTAALGATGREPVRRRLPGLVSWGAGVAIGAGLAGFALYSPVEVTGGSPPTLFDIGFGDSLQLPNAWGVDLALSRDGSLLAFNGVLNGSPGILLRRMDDLRVHLVRGAEKATSPSFSPDGGWLLFTSGGELKKVPVAGGAPITVAKGAGDATWGDRGEIVFGYGNLHRVSAEGGPLTLLASPDSQRQHVRYGWPQFLPGGRAVLITLWKGGAELEQAQLAVVTVPQGEVRELGLPGMHPRYVPSGHVVFGRPGGSVLAAPFSLRKLEVTGAPIPVLDRVSSVRGEGADLAVSASGTLVYRPADAPSRRLMAVERGGTATPLSDNPQGYASPRISPDGRRLAVTIEGTRNDVWTYDLAAKTLTRVTTEGGERPEWSPDGSRIAYVNGRTVSWQRWDGVGAAEIISGPAGGTWEVSFGPPGTYVAVRRRGNGRDIYLAPADSPAAAVPFLATPANEAIPRISPDGRFLAYVSDESGRTEVYVRPLPGPGGRVQISREGGQEPVWGATSRELFYRGPTHLIAATLQHDPELAVAGREELFLDVYTRTGFRSNYDVLAGGKGFVMVEASGSSSSLYGVVNWDEALRRRFREERARRLDQSSLLPLQRED